MSEIVDVFEVVANDGCVIHRIHGPRKLAEQWNRKYGVPGNRVIDASYVRHGLPAAKDWSHCTSRGYEIGQRCENAAIKELDTP